MPLTESQSRYVNFYTDFAFKKLFGTEANKDLLLSFLNSRFEGVEHFNDITYLNTEHFGDLDECPAELKEAIFNRLFEIAEIAKYTPEERMDYEESLKNFRDWYSCLKTAEIKGRDTRNIEIARDMKKDNMPIATIARYTGLSEDEINEL